VPERASKRLVSTLPGSAIRKTRYHFKLYVTGATARSTHAIAYLTRWCEEKLPKAYKLEVVDIYQQPDKACKDGILVAPTLVRVSPPPVRRYTGDFSSSRSVAQTLNKVLLKTPARRLAHGKTKIKKS
jgi:circadian clock protein KaiB